VVIFSIADPDVWFSDGYFDYVPHFLDGMAALPEMAPANQDHLLHSSSIITGISYGPGKISYTTFAPQGSEILRLTFTPRRITADGQPLRPKPGGGSEPGYRFDPRQNVLRIDRQGSSQIVISAAAP
jgi:hypothetical protein